MKGTAEVLFSARGAGTQAGEVRCQDVRAQFQDDLGAGVRRSGLDHERSSGFLPCDCQGLLEPWKAARAEPFHLTDGEEAQGEEEACCLHQGSPCLGNANGEVEGESLRLRLRCGLGRDGAFLPGNSRWGRTGGE